MTIKEVCKKYGLTQDTLRYYEKAGMIPPVHRTEGGIRDYTAEDLGWVELAKCMRSAGLPVEAIAEYVRLYKLGDDTIPQRLALFKNQMAVLKDERQKIISQSSACIICINCIYCNTLSIVCQAFFEKKLYKFFILPRKR